MNVLVYLIPIALLLGAIGLAAFLWSLKSGQYDDLDGAAQRILFDEEPANDNKPRPQARRARRNDGADHA
jgi:cbb3-type cytochrome oxidase maturation protein